MDIDTIQKKQIALLPTEVRQVIESVDLPEKIRSIAQKYRLHIDEEGALAEETTLVLWGLVPLKKYVEALRIVLGLNSDKATLIAQDMDTMLFAPIRSALIKLGEQNQEDFFKEEGSVVPDSTRAEVATNTDTKNQAEQIVPVTEIFNKEDLLADIENPVPTKPTVTTAPATSPSTTTPDISIIPAVINKAPVTIDTSGEMVLPGATATTPIVQRETDRLPAERTPLRSDVPLPVKTVLYPMPQNILAEKMNAPVQAGKSSIEIKEQASGITQIPKKTDPYRESI